MRPDRDQYVILHEENIDKSYLEEFKKIKEHQSILTDRKFDFQSISLYDPFVSEIKFYFYPFNVISQ